MDGSDAYGDAEGDCDLTHSAIVTSGPLGEQPRAFHKVGRPSRMSAMPSLEILAPQSTALVCQRALAAIWSGSGDPKINVVGNNYMGAAFFNGVDKCVVCYCRQPVLTSPTRFALVTGPIRLQPAYPSANTYDFLFADPRPAKRQHKK